ncbi:hypothetical protein ACO0QE_003925 [Hanseniaspora vineae]
MFIKEKIRSQQPSQPSTMKYKLCSKRLNQIDDGTAYKLLQLTPEMLSHLEDDTITTKSLTFKPMDGPQSELVLCTDSCTFVMKQKMHSNCVLLMSRSDTPVKESAFTTDNGGNSISGNDDGSTEPLCTYEAFSQQCFELEPRKIEGKINVAQLPIYDGPDKPFLSTPRTLKISLSQFSESSPCSTKEFYDQWYAFNGCVLADQACVLSEKFIDKQLHLLLLCIVGAELDVANGLTMEQCKVAMEATFQESRIERTDFDQVLKTILMKFSENPETTGEKQDLQVFVLDLGKIAQWYGKKCLSKYCSNFQYIGIDDFMIKWKSSFPPFFSCDIDLEMLLGFYCKDINNNKLCYLDDSTLPQEPKLRFNSLFSIQKSWLQQEIWPFVKDLNHQNLKPDTFLIKYARRKRMKRDKFIITSR